jgi:catechol 2,3-dioxygenase-like lactoylglutathione lyase family enzyme
MTIHRINFQSIPVADQDRALGFYRDAMGFEVQTDVPYDGEWRWIFLTLPEAETRLNFARRSEYQVNGVPALTLVSDDVDAEAERLRELGVTLVDGPRDAPWVQGVRYLTIRDSEDNLILLESRRA